MPRTPAALSQNHGIHTIKASSFRLSDAASSSTVDYAEVISGTGVPSGAYGRDAGATLVYLRRDASSAAVAVYVTHNGGTAWVALPVTDAEITALSGLTSAADKGIMFTGAGTAGTYDLTAAALTLLDDATVGDMRTTLGVQPLDSTLTSIATLGTAADKMLVSTGVDTWAEAAITAAGKALLDDASAGDQLTTLGITAAAKTILDDVSVEAIATTLGLGSGSSPGFADCALTGTLFQISGGIGAGTGVLTAVHGPTGNTGMQSFVWESTIVPTQVENPLFTVPANSVVDSVQANCMTALTGGGTTVSWSIGISGDVDAYGTVGNPTDSLVQFGKANWTGAIAANAGASLGKFSGTTVDLKLCAAATGGATAGDTALTVGSVKIRVAYRTLVNLADA